MSNNTVSIPERTKAFAIRVIKAYSEIIKVNHFSKAASVIAKQFLRSGTSIGANTKEAVSAQSKKDFISKYEIALKEARETEYWIEIMIESEIVPKQKFSALLIEVDEIIRILAASVKKAKSTSEF